MSQFLVVKDLNFENIMICFDNSSNELEYTTYVVDTHSIERIHVESANLLIEQLLNKGFEDIDGDNETFLNNQDEIKAIIKVTYSEDDATMEIYTYKEHDGGVQPIPVDQSIYSSRFDDMRDAIMQVLGGYINTEHIFEIEE